MALLNSSNELVYKNLKEQDFNSLPAYIKRAVMCIALFVIMI